jgi:putative ATP-binding cassette transporter
MRLFLFLLRASRWTLIAALAASLTSGFGSAWMVSLINEALRVPRDQLGAVGLRFAGIALTVLVTRWASETLFARLSQRTLANMRMYLSRLMLEAPYRHIEVHGSARLLAVLVDDVRTVSDFFVALPNFTMHGAVVIGCLVYLGLLSWQVFAFAIVFTLLGAIGYHFAHVRALAHLREARLEQDQLFKHFRALCDGAKELRMHRPRRRAFLSQLLSGSIERVRAHHTRGMTIYAASESWGTLMFFVFIGLVLFVFSRILEVPADVMSGYALIFLYMVLPMDAVLMAIPSINRTRIALERVEQGTAGLVNQKPTAMLDDDHADAEPARFESLRLAGITHAYHREQEDRSFLLGPIDLEIRRGELVFLIGGNGSGKTTLAKLLVGLYAPEGGQVILNGRAVGDADRDSYRQLFSAVFSDFYLFEKLLGLEGGSGDAIDGRSEVQRGGDGAAGGAGGLPRGIDIQARKWLKELQLDRKVSDERGVLSTTELSQGQRKRLALLVAYLEDRPFYVFDEWAADQDPTYKAIFYERLLPDLRARGKTVLVITHDDRYFDLADRCLMLDAGQLRARTAGSGEHSAAS